MYTCLRLLLKDLFVNCSVFVGDYFEYNFPDDENIGFAGNSTKVSKKNRLKSVSSSFRNLFRRKREKRLSSSHDVTQANLVDATTTAIKPEAQEYESATFPRPKKKPKTQ